MRASEQKSAERVSFPFGVCLYNAQMRATLKNAHTILLAIYCTRMYEHRHTHEHTLGGDYCDSHKYVPGVCVCLHIACVCAHAQSLDARTSVCVCARVSINDLSSPLFHIFHTICPGKATVHNINSGAYTVLAAHSDNRMQRTCVYASV